MQEQFRLLQPPARVLLSDLEQVFELEAVGDQALAEEPPTPPLRPDHAAR